jgi:hypothetical protein
MRGFHPPHAPRLICGGVNGGSDPLGIWERMGVATKSWTRSVQMRRSRKQRQLR